MFTLCKTVKIYQTINHYHRADSPCGHLVDSHEVKFQESVSAGKSDQLEEGHLKTVDSRSTAPRRTGISLSIRDGQQNSPSPVKGVSLTKSKKDPLAVSRTNSSAADSLRLRATRREDCDSPRIVESKITWAEMSPPRPQDLHADPRIAPAEEEPSLPAFVPLKKKITGTTEMDSQRGSHPKI